MYGLNILVYTSKMPSEGYVRYKEQEITVSTIHRLFFNWSANSRLLGYALICNPFYGLIKDIMAFTLYYRVSTELLWDCPSNCAPHHLEANTISVPAYGSVE